ncbi:MAG: glutathione S-transferase family protein [Gammaproteobacteria bacterium]
MLTLHHLNNSRSQRILWLLEELGCDYRIQSYQRDAQTNLAPPELAQIHPLGKSPLLVDGEAVIAESGAIVNYLTSRYSSSALVIPSPEDADYYQYDSWLQFSEGSAMLPFLLALYTGRLGDAAAPIQPRIQSEITNHLHYMSLALGNDQYFFRNTLSGADIMLSFVLEVAHFSGALKPYANLTETLKLYQSRPSYQQALAKGGPYAYGA